jgi:hypothetical protein
VNVHTKNEKAIINANEICQIHGILSGFEDMNVATKKSCFKRSQAGKASVAHGGKNKKSDRAITMFPPFALYFPCLNH